MGQFLIVSLMILLVVGIVIGIVWINQQRQKEMSAIAQALKLKFYPGGDSSLSSLLSQLEFFSHGQYRRVRNLIKGTLKHAGQDLTVAIFDYYYTIGPRQKTETLGQTVLLLYDPSLQVQSFSLRPENLVDKLGNLFGLQDINFADFPTFSKRYRLQGKPEQFVRSLFQPNLLKFYEKQMLCTEARGSCVVIFPGDDGSPKTQSIRMQGSKTYPESRLIQPKDIQPFLKTGLRLIDLLRHNSV